MLQRLRSALARTREVAQSQRVASEMDEELRFHLELEVEHNIARGMTADAARRAAVASFGGVQRFREETRDARGFVVFENIARDARVALRRMRRAPAFAFGAIATLAIGDRKSTRLNSSHRTQ